MTLAFDPNGPSPLDSGIFGLPFTPEQSKIVLVPVPFEATTSYGGGTADGPACILSASKQVDLFDLDTGRPYEAGIAMLPIPEQVRRWNDEAKALVSGDHESPESLDTINALCEQMNRWVYKSCKQWLDQGKIVGVIGGDHSTPYGAIEACAEAHPGMGVLHLDAHADLRNAYEGFVWSHASIMYNVVTRLPKVSKLVQVGIRDFGEAEFDMIQSSKGRIHTFFDARLARARNEGMSWKSQVDAIVHELPDEVYLSWDIDGLEATLCPHTGTPVPGGLNFSQAVSLLEGIINARKRIVGFDLNEVAPGPDGDEWDGNVGARLLYKMIGWTLRSQAKEK